MLPDDMSMLLHHTDVRGRAYLENEMDAMGIRLNKKLPNITYKARLLVES